MGLVLELVVAFDVVVSISVVAVDDELEEIDDELEDVDDELEAVDVLSDKAAAVVVVSSGPPTEHEN